MTKIFFPIFAILFVTVFTYGGNAVSAGDLPEWANGLPRKSNNSTCVRMGMHHGHSIYLDLDSITVEIYNPPYYQISALFYVLDWDNTFIKKGKFVWKYIWSDYWYDRKMYEHTNDDEWQYIPADELTNAYRDFRLGGEIAWWKCYGIDFYGNPFDS